MSLPIAFQIALGLLPAVGFLAGYFLGRSAPRDDAPRQIEVVITGKFSADEGFSTEAREKMAADRLAAGIPEIVSRRREAN